MGKRIRHGLALGSALVATGLLAISLSATLSSAAVLAPGGSVTDKVGDTINDELGTPLTEARADIVAGTAEYRPEGITLSLRVQKPGDPAKDTNWHSGATFAWWVLDTTGDRKPDYEAQYFADPDSGRVSGVVIRPGDDESVPPVCDASAATFGADTGYSLVVTPKCLGNPGSFSYRVHLNYDTKGGDDKAPVAIDVAPDEEWAGPITNASSPATPSLAPTAAPPTPAKPNLAPGPAPRGSAAAPAPAPAPAKPAPSPSKPIPAPATPAPHPAPATPAPHPATPAPLPADLARTGSTALPLANFGAALAFAGLTLLLSGRRRPASSCSRHPGVGV